MSCVGESEPNLAPIISFSNPTSNNLSVNSRPSIPTISLTLAGKRWEDGGFDCTRLIELETSNTNRYFLATGKI